VPQPAHFPTLPRRKNECESAPGLRLVRIPYFRNCPALDAESLWACSFSGSKRLDVLSYEIGDQVIALVASALRPDLFAQIDIRRGIRSLSHLLDMPVTNTEAADLFCQDLYKEFDLDRLVIIAEPTRIRQEYLAVSKR
jgi:hypothetical protein